MGLIACCVNKSVLLTRVVQLAVFVCGINKLLTRVVQLAVFVCGINQLLISNQYLISGYVFCIVHNSINSKKLL